jgi:CDP-paratose 2-epimerase
LTGPNHSGVELHGFLSYLIRCNLERRKYTIFGYKGKQVRDNIHSHDVVEFIYQFIENPRSAAVYNLGGGRENSVSILEAFALIEEISGLEMSYEYVDQNRKADHICYISDLSRIREHYPHWSITKDLKATFVEIYESWLARKSHPADAG